MVSFKTTVKRGPPRRVWTLYCLLATVKSGEPGRKLVVALREKCLKVLNRSRSNYEHPTASHK